MGRDLRHYARQTNVRLLIGFVLLLFLVGDGLIYLLYGSNSALMGLICLLGALIPIGIIILILFILEKIVQKANQD